ncbi:MAG: hypothetical protein B0D92_07785 [Spirochaeta sp. LUC14_002_19_P3]|nr:MAG: hypothetical protein B0D92_07785 [Spirochaeta sp. LUC14_002_19_P3]
MYEKLSNISNETVMKATGRGWEEWVKYIDSRNGADMTHGEIVKMLSSGAIESPWWQQSVTVGYEYAKNRRVVGKTAMAKFELGVQKTIPMDRARLWQLLFRKEGLAIWLGDIEPFALEPGTQFAAETLKGEIRSIRSTEMIRISVQTEYIAHPFTMQIYLLCPRNTSHKTSLRFHFEKLDSSEEREFMRTRFKEVVEKLCALGKN